MIDAEQQILRRAFGNDITAPHHNSNESNQNPEHVELIDVTHGQS